MEDGFDDDRTGTQFLVPHEWDVQDRPTRYLYAATGQSALDPAGCDDVAKNDYVWVFSIDAASLEVGTHDLGQGLAYFGDYEETNMGQDIRAIDGTVEFQEVDRDQMVATGSATFDVVDLFWDAEESWEESYAFSDAIICY